MFDLIFGVPVAHAQFVQSTSSLNTTVGGFLTDVWDYVTSFLDDGGFFLFLIAATILYIGIRIALKYLRGIGGGR